MGCVIYYKFYWESEEVGIDFIDWCDGVMFCDEL